MTAKTIEQQLAEVEDMRQRILDPDQPEPEPEEIYSAVQAMHETRGAQTSAHSSQAVPVITDLNSIFD